MISQKQKDLIESGARILGVPAIWFENLIWAESGGKPKAKNPNSSARGLIQWIDSRARDMGYSSSLDLVTKNPTFERQLNIAVQDLKRYAPFKTEHEFYLAVFRPGDRKRDPYALFPEHVRKVNKGINTPADYTAFVKRQAAKKKGTDKNSGDITTASGDSNSGNVFFSTEKEVIPAYLKTIHSFMGDSKIPREIRGGFAFILALLSLAIIFLSMFYY